MSGSEDKSALRLALRTRRKALQAEQPDAGLQAAANFEAAGLAHPEIAAVYLPQGGEIDCLPLARVLEDKGARLCLPVVVREGAPLVFRLWSPGDLMAVDALGIPAPAEDAAEVTPDLIVAPLLAFDRGGRRLGQGGGYYDRTLEALRRTGTVFALGLAFSGQETGDLTCEPHDQRLDAVLTESAYIPVEQD